jgi:hypothetical protein
MTAHGIVQGNIVVVDESVQLPDGARVEIRVLDEAQTPPDPFAALLARRAAYAGRQIRMSEILEEEKRDWEERVEGWFSR